MTSSATPTGVTAVVERLLFALVEHVPADERLADVVKQRCPHRPVGSPTDERRFHPAGDRHRMDPVAHGHRREQRQLLTFEALGGPAVRRPRVGGGADVIAESAVQVRW